MEKINYTKLNYFNNTICPNCGKVLEGQGRSERVYSIANGSEDYPDYNCWETFKCKDCDISASTKYNEISDIKAWKFPKNYEKTITVKQINYIKYLGTHFWKTLRYIPIITSKELASEWISQFVELLNEEEREKLYDDAIHKAFRRYSYKFVEEWSNAESGKKFQQFRKIYDMAEHTKTSRIIVELTLDNQTRNIATDLNIELNTGNLLDLKNTISNIDWEINEIREQVKDIPYPTKEEGDKEIEKHKEMAQHQVNTYYYDEDPWYTKPDEIF